LADEHRLEAEVLTPEGEVFRGELFQVSTRTSVGEVGIRARHAPMVARLVPCELRLWPSDNESEVVRYAQGEGWLEVFANRARLLVAEAVDPGELDVAELRERLADAERRVKETEGEVAEPAALPGRHAAGGSAAHEVAERERARAEAFIKIAER
jgi:F-type H+-transporting ATPase subunit epsilon